MFLERPWISSRRPVPMPFRGSGRGGSSGFSLVEVLISAALMLLVAISIIPLFMRSMTSNLRGLEATETANFSQASIEQFQQVEYNDDSLWITRALAGEVEDIPSDRLAFNVLDRTGSQKALEELFWLSIFNKPPAAPVRRVGDGAWVDAGYGGLTTLVDQGQVPYRRKVVMRQFSYADISDGVLNTDGSGDLVTLGDPNIFDAPLDNAYADSQTHIKQVEVELDSNRSVWSRATPTRVMRHH